MITRVWKGPELEGFSKGIQTLFIEGEIIDGLEARKFVYDNTDCKRVYLGAGGKGILEVTNFNELHDTCTKYGIQLVAEVLLQQLYQCQDEVLKNCYVVLTSQGYKTDYINEFKVDNYANVRTVSLYNSNSFTDLSTLKDGMYKEDKLLFMRGILQ